MIEPEMMEFLKKVPACCGKARLIVEMGNLNPFNEIGGMALCLECGDFVQLTGGQLDGEETDNYKKMYAEG